MLGRIFGKPGKAGKAVRPQQVPTPHGQPTPGNAVPGPSFGYGRQPIALSYALRLGVSSSLTSPSVRGRFRPGTSASPANRGGTPDFGAQQNYRGALARLAQRPRLNAQAGPSAQPGLPSTGRQNSLVMQLAAMGRPDRLPVGGLT